jgi:hypothetical protein
VILLPHRTQCGLPPCGVPEKASIGPHAVVSIPGRSQTWAIRYRSVDLGLGSGIVEPSE